MANGRRKRRFLFTPFHFPPNKFYSNLSFIYLFDLNLLFYHGSNGYLRLSSLSLAYKLWSRIQCHKFPALHCWFNLVEDLLFFPWNYGIMYGHVLQASSCVSEWRVGPGVVFRSNVDATSLWWKTRIARGAWSFWNWFPSSLVLPHFPELSHPGDFVASQLRF